MPAPCAAFEGVTNSSHVVNVLRSMKSVMSASTILAVAVRGLLSVACCTPAHTLPGARDTRSATRHSGRRGDNSALTLSSA